MSKPRAKKQPKPVMHRKGYFLPERLKQKIEQICNIPFTNIPEEFLARVELVDTICARAGGSLRSRQIIALMWQIWCRDIMFDKGEA